MAMLEAAFHWQPNPELHWGSRAIRGQCRSEGCLKLPRGKGMYFHLRQVMPKSSQWGFSDLYSWHIQEDPCRAAWPGRRVIIRWRKTPLIPPPSWPDLPLVLPHPETLHPYLQNALSLAPHRPVHPSLCQLALGQHVAPVGRRRPLGPHCWLMSHKLT